MLPYRHPATRITLLLPAVPSAACTALYIVFDVTVGKFQCYLLAAGKSRTLELKVIYLIWFLKKYTLYGSLYRSSKKKKEQGQHLGDYRDICKMYFGRM